jgi:hypothetical protein
MQGFKEYSKTEYQARLDTYQNLKRWYLDGKRRRHRRRHRPQKAWHFAESTRRTPVRNQAASGTQQETH